MLSFFWVIRRYILVAVLLIVTVAGINGQTEDRLLVPGEATEGSLDVNATAQVYVYTANAGETISLHLTSASTLSMILTDSTGDLIGQASGTDDAAEVAIPSVVLETAGQYYVTVYPAAGATVALPADFFLTLESDLPVEEPSETTPVPDAVTPQADTDVATFEPGRQISLPLGVQVALRWNTIDDLNLQVRDPVGGTLFWDSRTTDNGGTFGPDRNGLCEVIVDPPSDQTVETAEWPGGGIYVGSYEILVYYRTFCGGSDAVDFTVDVTVDGNALDTISGTLLAPNNDSANVYLSSFMIESDGTASLGESGPYTGTRELPVSAQTILDADDEPIALGETLEGLITNENYFQTYTFEGLANQIINVDMTALNGSLDTLLLVMNASGNIIADNDDIVSADNTNSSINALILPADGIYTIVATRYGKNVGGTEGAYSLTVSGSDIPAELLNSDLPSGNIRVFLQWDTNADLQLLVRDPFGDTVFNDEPAIRSGGRLVETGNINCSQTAEDAPPVYYIYWPENTFLNPGSYEVEVQYRSECNDPTPVTATLNIVVAGDFNERYVTSFSIDGATGTVTPSDGGVTGGSETIPWQPALPSATVLSANDSRTGSITPQDKFDLYVFEGQAGDAVTISLTRTSGNLDPQLFLIDPNNIELASNDDINDSTDSLISVNLQEDGRYTIIATHFGGQYGGTVGGYNLSLQIDR
jgi:uncharacterized protein YfaP (DUF2135 family)